MTRRSAKNKLFVRTNILVVNVCSNRPHIQITKRLLEKNVLRYKMELLGIIITPFTTTTVLYYSLYEEEMYSNYQLLVAVLQWGQN